MTKNGVFILIFPIYLLYLVGVGGMGLVSQILGSLCFFYFLYQMWDKNMYSINFKSNIRCYWRK